MKPESAGVFRGNRPCAALLLSVLLASCGGGNDAAVQGNDPAGTGVPGTGPAAPGSAPGSTPAPGAAPAPDTTPAPGATPAPDATPAPGTTPAPVTAPAPGTPPASTPAALPTVDAAGNVIWSFGPEDSTLDLIVQPFVEMPLDSSGRPPRLNTMTALGLQLFVGDERDGKIFEISGGSPVLWFDVGAAIPAATGRVLDRTETWHAGLRSIAFHPDFATNGKFYTSVMEQRPGDLSQHRYLSDVAQPIVADGVVIEWTADPSTLQVNPASYRELFRVGMATYDHTIKQIAFNPHAARGSSDFGMLYVAHGDGSEKSATVGGGQRNDALGKIIRINPLQNGTDPYSIPPDNPFVGRPELLDELWSIGHRNPHHLAFARDGKLIVAEPGRDNIDEINLIERGGNYGWSEREGTFVHRADGGLLDGIVPLPANDAQFGYTYPAVQFGHDGQRGATFVSQALGGGYVMENGSALDGRYFFCEFARSGDIYFASLVDLGLAVTRGQPGALTQARYFRARIGFDQDANPATPPQQLASMLQVVRQAAGYDGSDRADIRFGRGAQGELYLMSKRNRMVYRILNSTPGS